MTKIKKFLLVLSAALLISNPLFAASTSSTAAEPYDEKEFSPLAKEIRHAEIITFGSMPFVSIGVTMAYGSWLYFSGQISSFPNPLNKTSSSFTSDQTIQIFAISGGICVGLGITDWAINFIKRQNTTKRQKILEAASQMPTAVPLTEDEAKSLLSTPELNGELEDASGE